MLFPDGILYNRELDQVRTSRVNSFFSLIPELTSLTGGHKKGDSVKIDKIPAFVRAKGLEPSHREALDPKSSVSTNFTTPALDFRFVSGCKYKQFYKLQNILNTYYLRNNISKKNS